MKTGLRVLVTGGAGYVGAVLVPMLLDAGHRVRVLDLYLYGRHIFDGIAGQPDLEQVQGDIRDGRIVAECLRGCDSVIHLACISNDPSFELDPDLGRSINYDAFGPLVRGSKAEGARRFIYVSSSSVYGLSDAPEVTEDHPFAPLTDYSKYKALCETVLLDQQSAEFTPLVIRPATVCGYSPRQRLDLTVNILTAHAYVNRRITVFGGSQKRPHIHIHDLCRYYRDLLTMPDEKVAGRTYNAGYQNNPVAELARIVRDVASERIPGPPIEIVTTSTDDLRSYHIGSDRIGRDLGLVPEHTIEDAVAELLDAFDQGLLPDPLTDDRYHNVKLMKRVALK